MTLPPRVLELARQHDRLSRRERLMVAGAVGLVVLFVGWHLLLAAPLARWTAASRQLGETRASLAGLETALAQLEKAGAIDPDAGLQQERNRLQSGLETQQGKLEQLARTLVAPEQMAPLLHTLLEDGGGLRLVALRNEPVAAMLEPPVGENGAALYRHGLTLEFEGSYLDTLAYLRRLEQAEGRLFWDGLHLTVTEHPRAKVELRVHTLSLRRGLLGV